MTYTNVGYIAARNKKAAGREKARTGSVPHRRGKGHATQGAQRRDSK